MSTSPSYTFNGLAFSLDQVAAFAPVVSLHPDERYLPCTIEHILRGATLREATSGDVVKTDPTQDDMAAHAGDYRLDIAASQFAGQPLAPDGSVAAPMYVSVQVPPDRSFVDLNFQFLHAYNGAQCVRGKLPGKDFNCVLETFAEHQGDIEGMSVRVDAAFRKVIFVRTEAHGDSSFFRPEEVDFEGTHPLISCALNSHASYNLRGRNPTADDWFQLEDFSGAGFGALFIDVVRRNGIPWRPFTVDAQGHVKADGKLRLIGIDGKGEPVGTEKWAKFTGRLGAHLRNSYTGQKGIGGPLRPEQNTFIHALTSTVIAFNLIPEDKWWGDGPGAYGRRSLIYTERPTWVFPE